MVIKDTKYETKNANRSKKYSLSKLIKLVLVKLILFAPRIAGIEIRKENIGTDENGNIKIIDATIL